MNRRLIITGIAVLMLVAAAAPVFADSQVDIGINLPVVIGLSYQGESVSEQLPFTLPLPDLTWNYYFGSEILSFGPGVRVWTLIVASAAYPTLAVQSQLGPVVLGANFGGGLFLYHAVGNGLGVETGNVFFPEVSAAFRVNNWFSVGASVLGLYLPDVTDEGFGFLLNIITRFRVQG
jgi:hypothetical protein